MGFGKVRPVSELEVFSAEQRERLSDVEAKLAVRMKEAKKRHVHTLGVAACATEMAKVYGVDQYVFYEMAMVSGLNYYTGIIFSGYTFGSGEAVVKGGRYDRLLEYFGKSAPAIGFVIVIDQLMNALQRQNIRIPFENKTKWFVYSEKRRDEAIRDALVLRREGEHVEMMPVTDENTAESYRQRAGQFRIQDVIYYI